MPARNATRLHRMIALAALVLVAPVVLAQAPPPAAAAPPSAPVPDEASSYSIGLVFGNQLHGIGLDDTLSLDAVMRGLKDGLGGKALGPEDKERAMGTMRAGREAVAARNHAAARDFLAKNSAAAGIVTTASGLQYQVFATGDAKAAAPTLTDRVTVNYRGSLLDGTEFDNSDKHAQAATFGLNGVLKGWREALQLMKPGAKWRLFIPPELGYDLMSPPTIPPGSLLIFDVELLKVEPPAVMGPQAPKAQKGAKPAAAKKPTAVQPSP
jgi:FKBP-type peptidyl-prolyl cis-trans isomerase FklB